ncbi:DUF3046 domain-containing protein [Nocardioides campestrisoli]|uniref:DUF3046 domain-containing protein n=1 Tax=Nocardioides campestrisoli TaxID=2736757 RepID=UPI0015E6EAD0|nr:DUF3046 domain-containing protein [Nocardioides campestrisoli]
MRYTEFWARMDEVLGAKARSWAAMVVMPELGSRTVVEALDAGLSPKEVWSAVWQTLQLPEKYR